MGLKKQLKNIKMEELTSAYEYAREKYIQCPHWDEMKEFLRKDMDREHMAMVNCWNE